MKNLFKSITTLLLVAAMVFASSCTKNNDDNGGGNTSLGNVTVTTLTPTDITSTGATCGAEVTAEAGAMLMEMGVCWSTTAYPTINDSYLSTKNCVTTFVCTLENLTPETKYHVRAYVLNETNYVYGDDKEFITLADGGGDVDDHEWVDLGLPSGTLWATCNVGANTPEGYGDYFAWGETEPKTTYNWSTYKYCNGSDDQLTKYCTNSSYGYNGFTDNLITLQPSDDAATANWGIGWCMPTFDQCRELYESTTNIWTSQNGVNGRLFTASNGSSLFLPAAGCRWNDELKLVGSEGAVWSSSLNNDGPNSSPDAWVINFKSVYCGRASGYRLTGSPVRAVRSARQN